MPGGIVRPWFYPMLAVALLCARASAAQPTSPTPAPTAPAAPADRKPARPGARPSAPEHDLTTPKGTLKVLASALRDGDAGRIREVMYATTPAENRMVAAMADMAAAMAQLQKAAVKVFGEEGAKEIVGDTQATDAQGRARIDAADVRLAGDTATVIVPEGEDAPVVLKRVGAQWKVPMSELAKNADPTALEERLTELTEQRKLVAQLTDEIGQGQFKTPGQAKDAWQSRAMQAVTRRPPPRKPQPEGAKPTEPTSTAGDASARPASGQ
jgi:hypothetical protein